MVAWPEDQDAKNALLYGALPSQWLTVDFFIKFMILGSFLCENTFFPQNNFSVFVLVSNDFSLCW